MQQLQFVELDDGGRLVLVGDDGTRYAVTVDDRLRAALRPRPTTPAPDRGARGVGPREVQSLIRAGQSAQEVASATGWELERVRRFEGPVLAEREHVIGLAQQAPVRSEGRTDGSHRLGARVRERLQGRDVDLTAVTWDAARSATQGPWTVQVIFSAGGRERRAAWHYDLQARSLESLDDEARWLSEDEQALPGGLAGHPLLGAGHGEDAAAADLMASMRDRRQRRNRRPRPEAGPGGRDGRDVQGGPDPVHVPGQQAMPPEVLPLEDLDYDPATMGDPPAAHPRGAAPESPHPPVTAAELESSQQPGPQSQESPEPTPAPQGRARQQRRRLRLPKLPDPPVQDEADSDSAGQETYARVRYPDEVSFDEFFDMDEEGTEGGEDLEDGEDLGDLGEVDTAGDAHDDDPADSEEAEEAEAAAEAEENEEREDGEDEQDEGAPEADEPEAAQDQPQQAQDQPQRPARKGRPSVPSWDDIMFGSRDRG